MLKDPFFLSGPSVRYSGNAGKPPRASKITQRCKFSAYTTGKGENFVLADATVYTDERIRIIIIGTEAGFRQLAKNTVKQLKRHVTD